MIAVNDRVRATLARPGSQALLFVFYSGHADPEALHLGRSRLPSRLVTQLVSGSAATFRLLVVDACRLGAVTRAKGGRVVRAGPLVTEDTLPGTGLAVLSASAAHEDAQESEEIGGSFFTHAFVSGLMGAADQDGDGAVSLSEAYQYAYQATMRDTSRTMFGTQHPTFRFDFGGQGSVVLTRPAVFAATRAELRFPSGVGFLVLRDGPEGMVVGEIDAHNRSRTLSVRPGRYFIRGRGQEVLYEGRFDLASGTTTGVNPSSMDRIDYARLVRKGGRSSGISHGIEAGIWGRSPLLNADTVCMGGFFGYSIEFEHFGIRSRIGACTSQFSNSRVEAVVNEYDLEFRFVRTWDISFISLDLGLGGGAALFTQRFETELIAPPRDSLSPYLLINAEASADLGAGYALGLGIAGETHLLRLEAKDDGSPRNPCAFALRVNAACSKSF